MRVSDNQKFANITRNVNGANVRFAKAQQTAGSGVRVAKPSDDPVAAASARREASRKALGEAGVAAADVASDLLQSSDSALGDVYEALTSARELATQAATDTSSAENRSNILDEVRKIREQMVALGNTNVGGKYVFAGYRDQAAPFDSNGTFVGDGNAKELQALPGLKMRASISGEEIFGASGASDNAFATIDELIAGLENNDGDRIRGTLDSLQSSQDRVGRARSQVGSMMQSVELARNVADRQQYRATTQISQLTEADPISSALDLVQAKSALEAALAVAQQIPPGLAQRS